MRIAVLFCAFLFAGCSSNSSSAKQVSMPIEPPQETRTSNLRNYPLDTLKSVKITVAKKTLNAYVADDPGKQQEGLMFLQKDELKENDAMIFKFDSEDFRGFWMKNTLIDLDIAYLKPDGTILNILTMKALDESTYPSEGKAKYAVETNSGWFAKNKIKKGAKFNLQELMKPNPN